MTKRIYLCNICRASTEQESTSPMIGLKWVGSGIAQFVDWDCETHICAKCLRELRAMEWDEDKFTKGDK